MTEKKDTLSTELQRKMLKFAFYFVKRKYIQKGLLFGRVLDNFKKIKNKEKIEKKNEYL